MTKYLSQATTTRSSSPLARRKTTPAGPLEGQDQREHTHPHRPQPSSSGDEQRRLQKERHSMKAPALFEAEEPRGGCKMSDPDFIYLFANGEITNNEAGTVVFLTDDPTIVDAVADCDFEDEYEEVLTES